MKQKLIAPVAVLLLLASIACSEDQAQTMLNFALHGNDCWQSNLNTATTWNSWVQDTYDAIACTLS